MDPTWPSYGSHRVGLGRVHHRERRGMPFRPAVSRRGVPGCPPCLDLQGHLRRPDAKNPMLVRLQQGRGAGVLSPAPVQGESYPQPENRIWIRFLGVQGDAVGPPLLASAPPAVDAAPHGSPHPPLPSPIHRPTFPSELSLVNLAAAYDTLWLAGESHQPQSQPHPHATRTWRDLKHEE